MSEAWTQVITLVVGMLTLFLGNFGIIWWFRKESREDVKEFRKECRDDWKICNTEIKEMREEFKQFREMWALESKDFHSRLLKIEMGRK